MTTETRTELAVAEDVAYRPVNLLQVSPFATREAFQLATDMAVQLSRSSIIPDVYRDQYLHNGEWKTNPDAQGNCFIAIELANRLKSSPMVVIQNMDVIYGRPGLRGTFIGGLIQSSEQFTEMEIVCTHAAEIAALEKVKKGLTDQLGEAVGDSVQTLIGKIDGIRKDIAKIRKADDYGYFFQARRVADGKLLVGPTIDWAMVRAEKWDTKKDSKWGSIPEQMFQYRATSFWSRLHASHITLGLHETTELEDALEGEFTRVPAESPRTRAFADALDRAEAGTADDAPAKEPADDAGGGEAQAASAGRKPATERRRRAAAQAAAAKPEQDAATTTDPEPEREADPEVPAETQQQPTPAAAPDASKQFSLE